MKTPETDVKGLETGMKKLETDVKGLKTGMKGLETEIKILGISQKNQLSGVMQSQKDQLSAFTQEQQKQFSNVYFRGFFGVLGIAGLLIGGAWVLPANEANRLDTEIKRRAVIKDGTDKILQGA